ncbi:MAG: hypothetical protein K6U80_08765 [Firmicutes bacterium]|nr:hypothetical protein [Bacillota bacterium]
MRRRLSVFHGNLSDLIIPVTLLVIGLILPLPSRAEGLEGSGPVYHPDRTPPQIVIINPLPGGIMDTEAPLIEIAFMDANSDIDLDSIRLLLDRMDLTAAAIATIERLDEAEQGMACFYIIRYQPTASLARGVHEIDFSIRDQAGNQAETRWSFEVKLPPRWGLQASGSNTLQFNILTPLNAVQMFDLAIQGQSEDINIQLHTFGRVETNTLGNYKSYLDSYSLGIYRQRFALILGCAGISLNSELLQNSLETGLVSYNNLDFPFGQYGWEVFYGSTTNNSGVGFNVQKIAGVTGKWAAGSGWALSGFGLRLEGEGRQADFTDIKGNSPPGRPLLFRYELLHGDSRSNGVGQAGDALALHLDQTIATSVIGLDYMLFESGYPALEVTPIFSPGIGGAQRYALRGTVPFANGQSLSVDCSYAENNLDRRAAETLRRENTNLGYNWNPGPDFGLNANYSWDILHHITNETANDDISNNLSLNLRRNFNLASLQTSLSLQQTYNPVTGQFWEQRQFSGAWTQPLGAYNLLAAANGTLQNRADGSKLDTGEFKISLDRQLHPEVSRSSLVFSRTLSADSQTMIFKAATGVAANIYLKTRGNSNLLIAYCYNWTQTEDNTGHKEAQNQGCSLIWKCFF